MKPSTWIFVGALLAGMAVALGAFAAHVLEGRAGFTPDRMATWEVAVRYQMYHALALTALGLAARQTRSHVLLSGAAWAFLLGTLVFSGGLYTLVMTQIRGLGGIVPIGGVLFIAGWLLLACWAWGAAAPRTR